MGMPSQQPATEALEASKAFQARASHSDPRVALDDSRILFEAVCRDEMLHATDMNSMQSLFVATLAAQDISFPSITWSSDDESEHSDIDLTHVSYDNLVFTSAGTSPGLQNIKTDEGKGRGGRKRKRVVPSCAGRRMVRSREISSKLWMLASPSAVTRPFIHKNLIAKLA